MKKILLLLTVSTSFLFASFIPAKACDFNNGVPDPEKMQAIKSDVLGKLTGSRGEKVIVAFNNNSESKTTIDSSNLFWK